MVQGARVQFHNQIPFHHISVEGKNDPERNLALSTHKDGNVGAEGGKKVERI